MDFNANNDSSSDCQYVDDLEYIEENDDFCILDLEDKKIDGLTKTMNNYISRLENFAIEPLENISELKRNVYLLCEDNRYLIDDSKFLSNLELLIDKEISHYEDKLFMLSEQLVDTEINKDKDKVKELHERLIYGEELANKRKSERLIYGDYDKVKENHERLIYGEELANKRKSERDKEISNYRSLTPYGEKLANERTKLENAKQLEKDNANVKNFINSLNSLKEQNDIDSIEIKQNSKINNCSRNDVDKDTISIKFHSNKRKNDEIIVSQDKFLIGSIFTNSEYTVIKENLCFAYQVTEIKNNMVLAVSLKLDTITIPLSKHITSMSDCGSKKLHEPIEIISEPMVFEKSSFGKKHCIKNDLLCLVEYDNQLEQPIWTTIDNDWDR